MKRDMDLIRELLLKLEALPIPPIGFSMIRSDEPEMQVEGYTVPQIDYHLLLIEQAKLISADGLDVLGMAIGPGTAFRSVSWSGHDFPDSVRSPDVWDKTKTAAAKVGGYTVDILVATAKAYAQQKFTELLHGQR
ncbi:DUF2513 domain-containing protein [Paraburkholderia atlantica]|uniref:DUF2513 domain-containing protein n=1 Tax=Paraburkholderia atlantica TaxID=2654982 RepID=UPI00160F5598|nr:DUF2513 domain-containing protein [Paraburkholderia atlantica]MBB5511138.1 hypothetical protein [Paraburkholderia atlantica]